jgi:hypothetical protein
MAIPGDEACREVAPCPAGPYPELTPEDAASAQYVDASFTGTSDGSAAAPWSTLSAAVGAATPGAVVAIAPGSYVGSIDIQSSVRLWGLCPSLVEVVATPGVQYAINVYQSSASGTELRGFAIRSDQMGIVATGADPLTLDGLWIHDTGGYGLYAADDLGRPRVQAGNLLVERATGHGIAAVGAELTLEASVVRQSQPGAQPGDGTGIEVNDSPPSQELAALTVRRSVIADNARMGIIGVGADVVVEDTVVRDTAPAAADGSYGRAIDAEIRGSLAVRGCLIERNHENGIYASGVTGSVTDTVVRQTSPGSLASAAAIAIQNDDVSLLRAAVTVSSSTVTDTSGHGIAIVASDVTLETTVVEDTQPLAGTEGRGVNIQYDSPTAERGYLSVWATRIGNVHGFGLGAIGSDLFVVDSEIHDVHASSDGLFGDGVIVAAGLDQEALPSAEVVGASITRSQRAGFGVFGATGILGSSDLRCNGIDLAAETIYERTFTIDDRGANVCGCDQERPCKAITSQLQPPAPF